MQSSSLFSYRSFRCRCCSVVFLSHLLLLWLPQSFSASRLPSPAPHRCGGGLGRKSLSKRDDRQDEKDCGSRRFSLGPLAAPLFGAAPCRLRTPFRRESSPATSMTDRTAKLAKSSLWSLGTPHLPIPRAGQIADTRAVGRPVNGPGRALQALRRARAAAPESGPEEARDGGLEPEARLSSPWRADACAGGLRRGRQCAGAG